MTDIKELQSQADAFNDFVNREVKVWMVRRGEDLLTLAAKTGISKSKLSRSVYRSEGSLPVRDLKTICAALNVDMTVIISAADNALREQMATPLTDAQLAAQILARAEAAKQAGYALAAHPADDIITMNHSTPYSPDAHAAELGIRIIDAQPPAGTLALWDEQTRTIITTPGLLHRQRRCVLAHELAHATQGDTHSPLDTIAALKRERKADQIAAGWLLTPDAVAIALAIAPDSLSAAAAELEVTDRILEAWLRAQK